MAEGIKTLNFNILTSNNYNTKYISCGSDNNNIATVDYTGNDGGVTITAVSEGNTNIKFYTNSGHLIKSIPVNVYNKFEYSPLECIEFTYPTVSQFGTSDWITPIIKTSQTNLTTGKTNIKTYRNTLQLMRMGETISPNGDSWARISQMAAVKIYHKLNEGDPDQIYTVSTNTSCGQISAEIRQTYKPIDHGTLKITNLKYEDAEYDGGLHVSFEGNEQIDPVMFKPIWANWELQVYFEDDTNETIDCSSWDAQKYEKDGYYGWHSSTITCSFALDKEYDFIESFNPLSGAILFKENTSTKQRTCNVLMTATIYGISTTISITVKQNGNPNGTDSESSDETSGEDTPSTNVRIETGYINGHQYVDLGLRTGTLWATMDIGAEDRFDLGDLFAWGETEPKETYTWENYKYCNGSVRKQTKYCVNPEYWDGEGDEPDGLTTLLKVDDAATQLWGPEWTMPTANQLAELFDTGVMKRYTKETYNGVTVEGVWIYYSDCIRPGIFIPIAIWNEGSNGLAYYWSRQNYGKEDYSATALSVTFNTYLQSGLQDNQYRCKGCFIRPVTNRSHIVHVAGVQILNSDNIQLTNIQIHIGDIITLHSNVTPSNASNTNVEWSLQDDSNNCIKINKATFDSITLIGQSVGTNILICKSRYENVSTRCTIKVISDDAEPDTQDLILTATNVPTSVNNQSSSNITLTTNGPAILKLGTLNDQGNKIVYESDKFVGTGYVCQITQTGGTNHIIKLLNGMTGSLNINIVTNKIRVQATPVDSTQYEMTANSYWKNTNPIKIIGKNTITNDVTINEPERIDLKLESGTIWCSCNLMANDPADIGGYFAWGEILPKSTYNWETYKYCNGTNTSITKYCFDNDIWAGEGEPDQIRTLKSEDNAATQLLGENWGMPTQTQVTELMGCPNTKFVTHQYNDKAIKGLEINRIFGFPSIFLPISGYLSGDTANIIDETFYWSKTNASESLTARALKIYTPVDREDYYLMRVIDQDRCYGITIRPVWVSENASYPEPEPDTPTNQIDHYGEISRVKGYGHPQINISFTGKRSPYVLSIRETLGFDLIREQQLATQSIRYQQTIYYTNGTSEVKYYKCGEIQNARVYISETPDYLISFDEVNSTCELQPNLTTEERQFTGHIQFELNGISYTDSFNITQYPISYYMFRGFLTQENYEANSIGYFIDKLDNERGNLTSYNGYFIRASKPNAETFTVTHDSSSSDLKGLFTTYCVILPKSTSYQITELNGEIYLYSEDDFHPTSLGAKHNITISDIKSKTIYDKFGYEWTMYYFNTLEYANDNNKQYIIDGQKYIHGGEQAQIWFGTYIDLVFSKISNQDDTPIEPINIILPTDIPKGNIKTVDLNLQSGTLWANMNVGAVDRADIGRYFAWGELQPKSSYSWSNYKYCNGTKNTITKYCTDASIWAGDGEPDGLVKLQDMDNIVKQLWGPEWKMPTTAQLGELFNTRNEFIYVQYNDKKVYGVMFYKRGTPDESLFLPITGMVRNDKIYNDQDMTNSIGNGLTYPCGFYWSTDILGNETLDGIDYQSDKADILLINSNPNAPQQAVGNFIGQYRCYGMAIRPIHV